MNSCAIVIPVYKEITSQDELFSLNQSLLVFLKRDIFIAIPDCLTDYAEKLQITYPQLRITTFERSYFRSVKQYNRLLTSLDFYTRFDSYSHLCVCQLDVLSLHDNLDYWMTQRWDYIGAPIFEGYNKHNSYSFKTTLNGGFSLRNVQSAIRALRLIRFRYAKLKDLVSMEKDIFLKLVRVLRDGLLFNYNIPIFRSMLNEDLFWTFVTPRANSWFKIPPPDTAQYFAFDKHPDWLFERNGKKIPTAVHAWKRFAPEFTQTLLQKIEEKSLSEKP